ncbi:hypothetical protein CcI156_21165 [Frankia sp. CcI156]|uniref:Uncharacterized protein n=1 Tax=Frankia casuarinae (strain DSM 45818 / CECT 9043 / HFP020203 / CcI3) TaxID=106370 RepID=Q2JB29_FRACC|nr:MULTISPECIES: hypothetical protein [Frankia]ABD11513.1 hypothetical protein Francci3_2141 [Frankia casuarinae]ETA00122.1 hypothetical protein CcI6DRAFT_04454 [Frankia sp. CcI6]EYT90284.1 hypothetical protein ThrDRAFT_04095 [Frankia casuarinae]KDA41112.1 hypothetical protein BMG523Draft_04078 [Frankia sp. BMG5.23]KEZ34596.1 hypothetical protein CEDDRAFT_04060 [Frankia sp. CeD]
MADQYYGGSGRRGERFAQARWLAGQARQDRTTSWYVPLMITVIGAGAAFDAFGRGVGLLYALGLSIAFVLLTWTTIRLMPSVSDELNVNRVTGPRKIIAMVNTPVRTHGVFLLAAALPIAIALIRTVGFFVFGGALLVGIVVGVALAAAWMFERR